ncbi:hypothetical protein PSEUDO9AG_50778 [Pseudomonas sp. 9Ag]|nr:hypothetical protein PSEUDO9AG_50778 [Pseudomonas sp. 9Ag]
MAEPNEAELTGHSNHIQPAGTTV